MSIIADTHHKRVQFLELSICLGVFLELWGHGLESRGWELVPEGQWGGHGSRYQEYSGPLFLQTVVVSSLLPHPSRLTPSISCPLQQGRRHRFNPGEGREGRPMRAMASMGQYLSLMQSAHLLATLQFTKAPLHVAA